MERRSESIRNSASLIAISRLGGIKRASLNSLLIEAARHSIHTSNIIDDQALLSKYLNLSNDRIDSLRRLADDLGTMLYELNNKHIEVVISTDSHYPKALRERLGLATPPILYFHGNYDLMLSMGVAFCGSRRATEDSLKLVSRCSSFLAIKGYNVVSGNAKGVDDTAHLASLSHKGSTTLVLPTGILTADIRRHHRDLFNSNNYLIISEFYPSYPWRASFAMQRNRTIASLAGTMVLVEPGSTGGTFNAGIEALRLGYKVFIIDAGYPSSKAGGSDFFIRRGFKLLQDFDEYSDDMIMLLKASRRGARKDSLFDY